MPRWFVSTSPSTDPIGPLLEEQVIAMLRGGMHGLVVAQEGADQWRDPRSHPAFAGAISLSSAPLKQPSPLANAVASRGGVAVGRIVGALAGLGVLYGGISLCTASLTPKAAEQAPPRPQSLNVGDRCVFGSSGGSRVFGYLTKEAYDASLKAAVAHDNVGFREAAEAALLLEPGTEGLVLETSWLGAKRIRVTSGPFADASVWVPAGQIAPARANQ